MEGSTVSVAVVAMVSVVPGRACARARAEGSDASLIASSVCIANIAIVLLTTFRYIPLAVIAAILVFVAYRMIEREHFVRMFHSDKKNWVISLMVAVVTVRIDPIVGILLGTAIALLIFVEKLSRGQFELIVDNNEHKFLDKITSETLDKIEKTGDTIIYSIKGQLAYINGQSHVTRFEQSLSAYKNVILRLRELSFVDLYDVDAFDEIVALIKAQGKIVLISGASPMVSDLLHESREYRQLEQQGVVFKRTSEALSKLGY